MKTFGELKLYISHQKSLGEITPTIGEMHVQIYESAPLQFICTFDNNEADIKFTEYESDGFDVATVSVGGTSLEHAERIRFKLDDNIANLLEFFSNGRNIGRIVYCIQEMDSEK